MNVGETPDPTIQTTKRGVTRMTLMSPLNATNSQERKPYIYIYIYIYDTRLQEEVQTHN